MCGGYDAMPSGGVQPTVKMEHADRAGAQGGSMPMQQHMHGHGPLMTAAMLSMSSTPSLPPMQSQTRGLLSLRKPEEEGQLEVLPL